jgi:hypothetical protein
MRRKAYIESNCPALVEVLGSIPTNFLFATKNKKNKKTRITLPTATHA